MKSSNRTPNARWSCGATGDILRYAALRPKRQSSIKQRRPRLADTGSTGDNLGWMSDPPLCESASPGGGMVDAADLKSASRKGVGVRIPSWARLIQRDWWLPINQLTANLTATGP